MLFVIANANLLFLLQASCYASVINGTKETAKQELEKPANNCDSNFIVSLKQSSDNSESKDLLPKVTITQQIAAAPDRVWQAIKERRQSDSNHRKMLSYNGHTAIIKEMFSAMPILGDTFCTYEEDEIMPLRRLEYKLLNSNHLHQFQGTWLLSSGFKANTTIVSLSSSIDPDIRFPFWRKIATRALLNNLQQTLKEVSDLATKQITKTGSSTN